MKKVVSLLLVAVLLFTLSLPCFALAGIVVDFSISTCLSFVSDSISSYRGSIQKRTEAARGAFFNLIVEDKLCSGLTIFDSTGQKFTDDILSFYFDKYWEAVTGTYDYYDSNYDVFISASGFPDTPFSYRLLSFYSSQAAQSDYFDDNDVKNITFSNFKNYYNTFLSRYLLEQGQSATDPNPGKSGLDIAPGYVSSDELSDSINFDNTQYIPKTSNTWLMSYRNEKRYQTLLSNGKATLPCFALSNDSSGNTAFSELYLLPFFKDKNGEMFYGKKQLNIYLKNCVDTTSDVFFGFDIIDFASDFSQPVEALSAVHIANLKSDSLPAKYSISMFPKFGSSYAVLYAHQSLDYFIDNRSSSYNFLNNSKYETLGYWDFFNSSQTEYKNIFRLFYNTSDDNSYYSNIFKNSWGSEYDDGVSDIGYIASKSLINFAYNDIDTSKIPSGQIVTVSGDTIYNYTITNPDTGDSSKFGDYITNNYTYITNNYGEGGSGSGVGGNVTVGGEIEVGGSVGVDINVSVPDININVNQSGAGGSGSSIENPDDFTSADNVDLNKYYDTAVEQSTGFQKFLKDFFGFLPAELLALILFAVAMAIVCRVFGR